MNQDSNEEKSKIEELKKSLYSRSAPDIKVKRRLHFSPTESEEIETDWEHPKEKTDEEIALEIQNKNRSMSFFTKLFIASVIFFIIALGIGTFLVLNGANIISANNIDVSIAGPITTAGGDPISLDVQIENKNNVTLQAVDFEVIYPTGTVDPVDRSKELKEDHEALPDISPGSITKKTIDAVLYGEENSKKEITFNISYKVPGSNAVFKKQKTYEVLISSSPLTLSVNSYKEVISGQEFEVEVDLSSNSDEVIRNLLLKATYPFGFTLTTKDLKTENNSTTWNIGDIPSKGKKIIKFKGKIDGQDDDTRVFNFTVGSENPHFAGTIGTEYITANQEISIRKPFITTRIAFNDNDDNGDYVGNFNSPIKATVSWFNNLPVAVIDGEVHVKLSGSAFDKVSVLPGDGYYKSENNEIVWNKITTNSLTNIGPGDNGSLSFSFTPRDFGTPQKSMINPSMAAEVSIQGNRLSETNVPESIASTAKRAVKISSRLTLSSQVVHSQSVPGASFENTGPIPPKAEKQTTYTVLWTVNNTVNTVTGAEARALLPAYVNWIGKTSPADEDISYNSNTGEVVWKVGNVDTDTANRANKRQVAFVIGFNPSVAQVGQVPTLVQDTTLSAQDDFTNETLTSVSQALNTRFSTDPSFHDGQDIVQQ